MEINLFRANNNLFIEISGRVVSAVCDIFRDSVIPLIDKGINQVYVDLGSVDFIDSAGLGVLVGLRGETLAGAPRIHSTPPRPPPAPRDR